MYLWTTFTCLHLASCAHEQKAHGQQWVRLIGVANINALFATLVAVPKDSKLTEATFSPISTDLLCLRVAQMPRSLDLAIFVVTTDDRRQTKPTALPLAHARGVKRERWAVCDGVCSYVMCDNTVLQVTIGFTGFVIKHGRFNYLEDPYG